jgi:hypothetical protein
MPTSRAWPPIREAVFGLPSGVRRAEPLIAPRMPIAAWPAASARCARSPWHWKTGRSRHGRRNGWLPRSFRLPGTIAKVALAKEEPARPCGGAADETAGCHDRSACLERSRQSLWRRRSRLGCAAAAVRRRSRRNGWLPRSFRLPGMIAKVALAKERSARPRGYARDRARTDAKRDGAMRRPPRTGRARTGKRDRRAPRRGAARRPSLRSRGRGS